jgi:hypothetical protein
MTLSQTSERSYLEWELKGMYDECWLLLGCLRSSCMTTVCLYMCNSFVLGNLAKHLQLTTVSMSCPSICPFMSLVSNLFMEKDHTLYCGLVCRLWVKKMTISGICNCLSYCEIFIMYTHITNVAADCVIQVGCMRLVGRRLETHGTNNQLCLTETFLLLLIPSDTLGWLPSNLWRPMVYVEHGNSH